MHAVRAEHEIKDWDSRRNNKNGLIRVIENLEEALTSGSQDEFYRTLAKIDTSLSGEGYFASKFVNSKLPNLLIGLLPSDSNPNPHSVGESKCGASDGERVAAVIARGCNRHAIVLNKFAEDFFPEILQSLNYNSNENLYSIIETMSTKAKWLKFLSQQTALIDHLTHPSVQRFSVLEKLSEASISKGVVELSLNAAVEVQDTERAAAALRCLQAMTFYPFGREEALRLNGVAILVDILDSRSRGPKVKAPAAGSLTNLLEDPSHASKSEAIRIGAPDALAALLRVPDYEKDVVTKDQVLFALQAISVLCTEPVARQLFLQEERCRLVSALTKSSCNLVARTAQSALQIIQWKP